MLPPASGNFALDVDEGAMRFSSPPPANAMPQEITGMGVAPTASPGRGYARRGPSGANDAVRPSTFPQSPPQPMRAGTGPQPMVRPQLAPPGPRVGTGPQGLVRRPTTGSNAVVRRSSRPPAASYQKHPGLARGLGLAPTLAFREKGPIWLAVSAATGALAAGLAIATDRLALGGGLQLALQISTALAVVSILGVSTAFHRVGVKLGRDERVGVDTGPWLDFDPLGLASGGMGSTLLLALFSSPALAIAWTGGSPVVAFLAFILPAFIWPVALGVRATNGVGAALHPVLLFRAFTGGGTALFIQAMLGGMMLAALGGIARLYAPLVAGAPLSLIATILFSVLYALALTYLGGVLGYVFGLRAGSAPEVFDFLERDD